MGFQLKNELSVRRSEGVGGIFRGMLARGELSRLTDGRIIILVHGFNVSAAEARSTYQEFLTLLMKKDFRFSLDSFGSWWGFHWPGDHDGLPLIRPVVSGGTFSVRIGQAGEAGHQLMRFLERLSPDQNVYFIAHSLGCRVVLETLFHIADRKNSTGQWVGASVRGTFLMAAAVPYMFCEGGDEDGPAAGVPHYFRKRPSEPDEWVFFSPKKDGTLKKPFQTGEWLHGEGGGEAVGRHGLPEKRWRRAVETNLDHGAYWYDEKRVISTMPELFGSAVPHPLRDRAVPLDAEPLALRRLPERRVPLRPLGAAIEGGWRVIVNEI